MTSQTQEARRRHIILAVDDEPKILTALTALLGHDFEVLKNSSGAQAIDTLKSHDIAVILSDQRMPGMTGDEFLKHARGMSDATRLLITGYADHEATVRAVNEGNIFGFVAKPWDPAKLVDTVHKAADHHVLKRELEHERRLLSYLMHCTTDAIYFRDEHLNFTRTNRAYAALLGRHDAPVELGEVADFGRHIAERTAGLHESDRAVIESRAPTTDQIACVKLVTAEERWHSVSKAPMLGEHGLLGLVGIARDITERRNAAEELRRSNSDLEKFAYVASHDLQEPLRTVTNYLQLLQRRAQGQLDAESCEFIRAAVDGAQRMRSLIQGLLEYSRIGRDQDSRTAVDMNTVVAEAIESLRRLIAETGTEVTWNELPQVLGNPRLLTQMVQNLIDNAIKFRSEIPPRVRICAVPDPAGFRFEVADNGIGIDPKFRERVFEMFQRLHERERYPGNGIGLALCQRIVERHGGQIHVEGEVGKGTTICFTLHKP